ncbi:MAG: MBL fold metallo-hydrolase [Atopobiaceae bacterium]|nr:MBL fold metallo-hydrolase [Atopobiaceae bacterium]
MKKRLVHIVLAVFVFCAFCLVAFGGESHVLAAPASHDPSALRVSFIDVGKGDCILAQAGDTSVLIDAGYEKTAADVLAYLKDQGVEQLDAMVLTHYDRDHVGGVAKMGRGVDVETIYLPEYVGADENYTSCMTAVRELGVPTKLVKKELSIDVGGARLTILPSGVDYEPGDDGDEGNDNDASLVVTLVNGRDSYLFAGDLEEDGIDAFLEEDHDQYDVLKMAHHGRRSKNTAKLLESVQPQIAVITDSKKDPADKKTLKLLEQSDVEVYRTSADGTVTIDSKGDGTYEVTMAEN